ncbi:MAG: MoxR family ATPase [Planctomycetes bacterium]|nr:MoxR family ATPase [Planctomycetota bacterium]NOG53679.1 MoxR family ATPase [Planctomycetota bacterium]
MAQPPHNDNTHPPSHDLLTPESFDDLARCAATIREQIRKVIVGQDVIVEQLLTAVFCHGHVLIVGVPGLAKTLLVRTLAKCLNLSFSRIQFTPDMMPSDVLGTELIQQNRDSGERSLKFIPGPVFANIILADEINRTPPKTQSALLECMAEHQVSVAGSTRALDAPFIVVATQNPIEQEGTYPLPEAQLDRFMLGLWMDYPSRSEERLITADIDRFNEQAVEPVFGKDELLHIRQMIAAVPVSEHVVDHAVDLVRATRPGDESCHADLVRPYVAWGAGPRAAQHLVLQARCLAALEGRPTPAAADVRKAAMPVLRHRLVLNYTAIGERLTTRDIIDRVLSTVAEPQYDEPQQTQTWLR